MLREKMDLRIKSLLLPFTDFSFYKRDLIAELAKSSNTVQYHDFFEKELLQQVYPIFNRTNRIYNLDEVKLLIKKYFPQEKLYRTSFKGENVSHYYLEYLSQISHIFLTHRNGKISLKYWKSEDEDALLGPYSGLNKVAMWNSMDRMFTTEILVILYLLRNGMTDEVYLKGYHTNVHLADTQLEQVLSRGVAETHMHLNAGGNFGMNWLGMMSPINNSYDSKATNEFYDQVISKDFELQPYIRAMVIVRILLANYLKFFEQNATSGQGLYHFYQNQELEDQLPIPLFLEHIYKGKELHGKSLDFEGIYQDLQLRYQLVAVKLGSESDWRRSAAQADIIHTLLDAYGQYNTVENLFLFKCLRYMITVPSDNYFAQIFWQYLRTKNETFQIYIQANQIRGLDNFIPYCARATEHADKGLIIHHQLQNPFLQKVELRMTTGGNVGDSKETVKKKLASRVKEILSYYRDIIGDINSEKRSIPNLGIVFHFIKKEDENGIEKCWLEYNPFLGSDSSGQTPSLDNAKLYFRQRQEDYRTEMAAVRELRESIPGLSDFIVGIDAAGSELAVEPWVFAPVFKEARNSTTHKLLYKGAKGQRIRNLGLTYHAGEDFRHLLTGIRRVHEVIEHFQFHAGDRIGHGISLGINPKNWQTRNRVVILPRIEHLENLLWVWGVYKDGYGVKIDATYLEQEILSHAEQIYKDMTGITVYNLWKAYRKKFKTFEFSQTMDVRQDDKDTSQIYCPYVKSTNTWNEERLTYAQHCKCYLHSMNEPIEVEVSQKDISIIEQIQKVVREVVSREGIVIEANPTSNTTIGEIENIFEHHIATLNQRGLQPSSTVDNGLMVSINTDDPIVFNTNINNEIAYIFYSLLDKGYSRDDILVWIDKVREIGIQSSFVESRQIRYSQRINELNKIITQLEEDY
ncbi:hypothetical protein J1P26_09430 [Neobacillus sp. MM2021_6]|uniref:hypothetical protein n=1 Tax=Bacillaceae TaxID=186817 RepID=UPI00140DB103|nr:MULTISPECIES: hypothetical protein [Bacillaceae]MBO0959947.1 hypothetical protein [Neobacillus sp. MM2021_6]NHC18896.1 hypothetical protein [Bacillus sp. MM2020_4]